MWADYHSEGIMQHKLSEIYRVCQVQISRILMFPEVDDFIEVESDGSPHHGLIGRVVSTSPDKVTVNLYGRNLTLSESDVSITAKLGSRRHALLTRKSMEWDMDSLDGIGLYVLMDIALWLRDFDWCKDIHQIMAGLG
jgi:hypothetical protein